MPDDREVLRGIRTFPQLVKFLRDELDWPISSGDFEELTFDYTAEELGIEAGSAAKIQEIKRLRPLSPTQPWGIFFVKFEPKRLPVVALRRVLSRVVVKKRASANSAERAAWKAEDLLFISNYGESDTRQISFAHFAEDGQKDDLATLKVLGWNNLNTALRLDDVADTLRQKLAWPEDEQNIAKWRERWSSAFTLEHKEVITTSKALATRLAELARAIRDRITAVIAIETDKGPLRKLMAAVKEALIHDLDEAGFADMYAQTITYGLLSARITNPKGNTADDFAAKLPVTNPFLKDLMGTFLKVGGRKAGTAQGAGIDFDELGVSEVVELLDDSNTNMEAVVHDFGDLNPQEDPVTHFYEGFANEYDPIDKVKRGVFYTPRLNFQFASNEFVGSAEFAHWPSVPQLFELTSDGIVTARDGLVVGFSRRELLDRIADFRHSTGTPRQICERFEIPPDSAGFDADQVLQALNSATDLGKFIIKIQYRPFDYRYLFYFKGLIQSMR
ncbi:hypothetical protein BH18ACI4_BH18ACI4_15540 [soil metagenome]